MAANIALRTRAQSLTQRILKSRPTNIPSHVFEGLATMGCTESEILALTKCTKGELDDQKEALSAGRARLKHSIRRAQIKAALKGNSSMLIWLGKMHLAQRENLEPTLSQQTNIVVDAKLLSALQSSYRATLADIRQAKDVTSTQSSEHAPNVLRGTSTPLDTQHRLISNPVKEPADLTSEPWSGERGTLATLATHQDTEAYPESHNLTYLPDTQCTSYGTEPITSHNTDHISLSKSLIVNSESFVPETHPPVAAPTPQTHPPSPQMPMSLAGEFLSSRFLGSRKPKGKQSTEGVLKNARARGKKIENVGLSQG